MLDKHEQKALDDIEKYGCHILQVFAEGDLPPFSYSLGIAATASRPDLCVIGLKESVAGALINIYSERCHAGETFAPGKLYSGFLDDFDICFEVVSRKFYEEYFGWSIWYNRGTEFSMLQLIYPTTSGVFPWSKEVSDGFKSWQRVLTEDGRTSFDRN